MKDLKTFTLLFPLGIALILALAGCSSEKSGMASGCRSCHDMALDKSHDFACTSCHQGASQSKDKAVAHKGLINRPAHPDNMEKSCGSCHPESTAHIAQSLHYTLQNSVNQFRHGFGAETDLQSFLDTPVATSPKDSLELADDLLRRRCFRCHLFTGGDNYPSVLRGTGCSGCHLAFAEGKLVSHNFKSPGDQQCLSCHYGNYVGSDYYGRFEHDYNGEYRTPYTTREEYFRPYGVEYHQLSGDVHQQRGLVCIDCHSGSQLMGVNGPTPSCEGCHLVGEKSRQGNDNISVTDSGLTFTGHDGKLHPLPQLHHPAHFGQQQKIACQSCHAQWTFNDTGKHFLRSDTDNYDLFETLLVQGSGEIEGIVSNNNDFDRTELPLEMTDKITGASAVGLWYKGYTMRRWEQVLLGRDAMGVITPVRPLLDYALSWIDEDDKVRFDSVMVNKDTVINVPYTPHTTGAAGLFYAQRIQEFLKAEQAGTTR